MANVADTANGAVEGVAGYAEDVYGETTNMLSNMYTQLADLGVVALGLLGKLILIIIVYLIGKFVIGLITRVLRKILNKAGADAALSKIGVDKYIGATGLGKKGPSELLVTIVKVVLLVVLWTQIVGLLGLEELTAMVQSLLSSIFTFVWENFIPAAVIIGVGLWVAGFVKNIVLNVATSANVAKAGMLAKIVNIFIIVAVAKAALDALGVDTSIVTDNLTIIIAGAALAFGLGGKDTAGKIVDNLYNKFNG